MSKALWTGCVALALALACAGPADAAPDRPDPSPERCALAELPAPLNIQFQAQGSPVGYDAVEVGPVGTTLGSTADAPAAIPLPAGVYVGLVGLASTFAAWRRFKRRRI